MTESPELIDQAESLYDTLLPLMQADSPDVYGRKGKAQAAIVEALALRTPSDGVKVKPLEWEEDEPGWWCAQPAAMIGGFGYEVRITDSGKVRARRGRDDWADFNGTNPPPKPTTSSASCPPSPERNRP